MRIPRFFVAQETIDNTTSTVTLVEPGLIAQIKSVLRLGPGDQIDVLDGLGHVYRLGLEHATNSKHSDRVLQAKILSVSDAAGELPVKVEVALPILRSSRYEWALEKLTELGAARIVPIIVEHSVLRQPKLQRWRSIAREAAEQCERGLIPEVVAPLTFEDYLKASVMHGQKQISFICVERSERQALPVVLCNQMITPPHKISVIVGAEGGFTAHEIELAEKLGVQPVSLGKRVLRAETAAIYALTIIVSHLDQNS